MGLAVALSFYTLHPTPYTLFVVTILALLFLIDLDTGLLPDVITYPASLAALLYLLVAKPYTLTPNLLSGAVPALAFALLIILTRGKGMGWGDVKYVFFLGLVLGFPSIVVAIFLAFLLGAVVGIGLILIGNKKFGQTIPFGPFLSLGAYIALLYGSQLIRFYLSWSL